MIQNFAFVISMLIFAMTSSAWSADKSWDSLTKYQSQELANFDLWSALVRGRHESEVWSSSRSHDLKEEWVGADGKTVKLVVRQPVYLDARKRVVIHPPAPNEDARPYFEAALLRLRNEKANTLSVAPGNYNFFSTEKKVGAHLLLEDLSDFILEGKGAVFNFYNNAPGIRVQQSQRVRIEGVSLNFDFRTTSVGRIESRGLTRVLVIDSAYPVTAEDKLAQVAEIEAKGLRFVTGGARAVFGPTSPYQSTYVGSQTYESKLFERMALGTRVFVMHHWYGASAIKVDGHRTPNQTEDITIANVNFHSGPGMGVSVTGLKRGIAIVGSSFVPGPGGKNPGGIEWDGIHVHLGGGDILISNNRFSVLGDDAVNLSNPIHSIRAVDHGLATVVLGVSSRFITKGDKLAFFDEDGKYLGVSSVTALPLDKGNSDFAVQVDKLPTEVTKTSFVRDIALITSRYKVSNSLVENINGHGVLAQIPNGLIQQNVIRNIPRNAIRLLSDIGNWNEGVGSFNVVVRDNTLKNIGIDPITDVPWAAIAVYGSAKQRKGIHLSKELVNEDIEIVNNTIENYVQGCIAVANSRNALVKGNKCISGKNTRSEAAPMTSVRSTRLRVE